MTFLLSFLTAYPKASINVKAPQSLPKHPLPRLDLHCRGRLNPVRGNVDPWSNELQARFSSKSNRWLGFTSWCDFPAASHISALDFTSEKLRNLIVFVLLFVQISSPLPFPGSDFGVTSPAKAILYSPNTKVPRTGEVALRRSIPANANMKAIQESLEDISFLLRIPQRKPYGTMEGDVKKALKIAMDEKESILSSLPSELREKGSGLFTSIVGEKGELQSLLEHVKENDPDKVSAGLASSLNTLAELELLQAPGLSFLLPQQYAQYPRLTGRAAVEFTIAKVDGSTFSPEAGGEARNTATIQIVLDGYSAPLTAGNFAKLVR